MHLLMCTCTSRFPGKAKLYLSLYSFIDINLKIYRQTVNETLFRAIYSKECIPKTRKDKHLSYSM